MNANSIIELYDVVVIGGGAAGVGVSIALRHAGVENFVILDRQAIGASFAAWPAETRFITPSFPTNSIGMLDLNSIAIGVSPAFSLEVEHPTGEEYASHLRGVAEFFELPSLINTDVLRVNKIGDVFHIETEANVIKARHVIWAAGEFQYPDFGNFEGNELCRHTATISSYEELEGDDFIVIGGYESGVDAAFHLSYYDKRVQLFDRGCPWKDESSDPSVALSTFSLERMREEWFIDQVKLFPNTSIKKVVRKENSYEVQAVDGQCFQTPVPPLMAGGFEGSCKLVANLFDQRDDGYPLLNEQDESTIMPGIYLCGPAVRHDNHIFCFIYKYRQRFAVVAKAIANSLGLPAEELEKYRQWGMYLDDLSCCGEECASC